MTVKQEEAVMAINQHPWPRWVGNSSPESIRRNLFCLALHSKPATPLIVLAAPEPTTPNSSTQKDKEIPTAPNKKIPKGMKSLSTPNLTIQKDVQPAPTSVKPLLEVFTTLVNPIGFYSPLSAIQPPVTDTHSIPWVYQAPNQDNQGEV